MVIVARYKEDVSWLENVKCPYIVYDKSGLSVDGFVPLPNIGREGATYLHHIVENYDNLHSYNIFIQGYPFDHCKRPMPWNEINFLEADFSYLRYRTEPYYGYTDWSTKSMVAIFEAILGRPFRSDADYFTFGAGACFLVSRKFLHLYPKSMYEKCLGYLTDPRTTYAYGYGMEKFWGWLFNRESIFNFESL